MPISWREAADLAQLSAFAYDAGQHVSTLVNSHPRLAGNGWRCLTPGELGISADNFDAQGYFVGTNGAVGFVAFNEITHQIAIIFKGTADPFDLLVSDAAILAGIDAMPAILGSFADLILAVSEFVTNTESVGYQAEVLAAGHSLGGALAEQFWLTHSWVSGGVGIGSPGVEGWQTDPNASDFLHVSREQDRIGEFRDEDHGGLTLNIDDYEFAQIIDALPAHDHHRYAAQLAAIADSPLAAFVSPTDVIAFLDNDESNALTMGEPWPGHGVDAIVWGGQFGDNISSAGFAAPVIVEGGGGADSLTGSAFSDALSGGAGSDSLSGGAGNDTLYGGTLVDYLEGGAGDDVLAGQTNGDFYSIGLGQGYDIINDQGGGSQPDVIRFYGGESVTSLSQFSFDISGSSMIVIARDAGGVEVARFEIQNMGTVAGAVEQLVLYAGAGDGYVGAINLDSVWTQRSQPAVVPPANQEGPDAPSEGDATFVGGAGTDVYAGSSVQDVVLGLTDWDVLQGGGEDDILAGGSGGEWTLSEPSTPITSGDEIRGEDGNDILIDDDPAAGALDTDYLDGGAGDDTVVLYGPAFGDVTEYAFGGPGHDTAIIDLSGESSWWRGILNWDIFGGGVDLSRNYTFSNGVSTDNGRIFLDDFETYVVLLGGLADTFNATGNPGRPDIAFYMFGGGGNDWLAGGLGDDQLHGGDGDDTLQFLHPTHGSDWLDGGAGFDTVELYYHTSTEDVVFSTASAANPDGFTLFNGLHVRNVEAVLIITGSGDDLVVVDGQAQPWCGFTAGSGEDRIVIDLSSVEGPVSSGGGGGFVVSELYGVGFEDVEFVTLYSGSFSDVLYGNAAQDFLSGNGGNDSIRGYDNDDVLSGGDGADSLEGDAGRDELRGDAGDDNAYGGDASDTLFGGDGADNLNGQAGDDSIYGDDDELQAGADYITGGSGDDVLEGLGGNDRLFGDDDDDILRGGSGDDYLVGGVGVDWLDGGFGSDAASIDFGGASSGLTLIASSVASESGITFVDGTHVRNVESFELTTGSGNDHINFDAGLVGYNAWNAGGGTDHLTVDLSEAETQVWAQFNNSSGTTGYIYADGGSQRVDFNNVESMSVLAGSGNDIFYGGAGNDMFVGNAGADELRGYDGDDILHGGDGADYLEGGSGSDSIVYASSSTAVTVDLSTQAASGGHAQGDSLSGIENAVGSVFDDVLIGSAGANRFEGRGGADWIVGGAGDDWFVQGLEAGGVDTLFGDAGIDTIDYGAAAGAIVVQLAGYSTSNSVTLATFTGIENAIGSAFNDALIGDAANNRLEGGAGADWIVGAAGDDVFVQGIQSGAPDRLFGDAGADAIDYAGATAGVTVQLSGYSTSGGVTLATFTGIENAIGTSLNDALIGNAANNRITGGAGADWLVGQAGDDTFVQGIDAGAPDRLFGDAGIDTIDYSGAGAGVTVQLSGYATSGGVTLATFTGIENAIGTAFTDALIGNAADNRITGGAGGDWLVGGAGNDVFVQSNDASGIDRLFGDAGIDTIDYSGASAGVTVQLSGYSTSAGATLATFTGMENAVGTAFNDALIGNASDNSLAGAAGADWLVGQGGADAFVYQSFAAGTDTIADFSRTQLDRVDLSAIDPSATAGDQQFIFSTVRTAGQTGEVVATSTSATTTVLSLYLDADNVADQVINVIHESGLIMNADDFVL